MLVAAGVALMALVACGRATESRQLLNVSYDPTREFYRAFNAAFIDHWRSQTGEKVRVFMSHGGSGKQARAVSDGLEADVVTLGTPGDIDLISARTGRVPENWRTRLPDDSAPYSSTIVLLVRKGNPRGVRDWDDLAAPGIEVVCANPKTSGGARWNYLAALAFAHRAYGGDQTRIRKFISDLYGNVPVLDSGARGAMTTFAQRGIGDVLITWENEALLAQEEFGEGEVEVVYPSISIEAVPPVALVEGNAERHGVRDLAQAYLEYLYSADGQRLAAAHFFRPRHPEFVDPAGMARFREIERVKLEDVADDWASAQKTHFAEGGVFDQIYHPRGAQ